MCVLLLFLFCWINIFRDLHSMVLVYIIHDKGKLLTIVDPFSRHFELKILPPFFENTEILRRDVQVLDHILTMKIPPMPWQAGLLYRWDLQAEGGRRLSTVCKYQKAGSTMGNNILSDCIQYSTYVIIRNVFKTIYDVYISYFKLSFYITILFRNNVIPPANPNGKGGMVAQAFAVVIVGLCTVKRIINIKWGFISIVNIWSKTCTSRRSISVFSKKGICSLANFF